MTLAKLFKTSVFVACSALAACGSVKPPTSQMPDARTALGRLDATYAQVSGVRADAKIDYLGDKGRVRGDVKLLASAPSGMRIAITADVVGSAGEVATDGATFEADDKTNGRFLVGEATPCNIARLTQVPIATRELVPMLWGMRPAIDRPIVADSLRWSDAGYYVLMLVEEASEKGEGVHARELHVVPTPSDWSKPYAEQRLRLLEVDGWSSGASDAKLVYRVEMRDHAPAKTAGPIVDSDGISPDVAPSGPDVTVDVPRALHVEVPAKNSDVVLKYGEVVVNPPLLDGVFELRIPPGIPVDRARCDDASVR